MSLLDRIATCHQWDTEAYRPFVVGGRAIGRVRHDFARRLADFPPTFSVSTAAVELDPRLEGFADRSEAVAEVLGLLHEAGEITRWRDECYPVVQQWGQKPLFQMERGAVPYLGVRGYGVHLNGFVRAEEGLKIWVGRRSLTKQTGPGKLDQIAAGGQPYGIGLKDNMVKEAQEEAAIPLETVARAIPVGAISYRCERPEGLRDDVLFCFDLELPPDFAPTNTDGEVDSFHLWPIAKVMEVISETDDFKFNCALVVIDFLLRHGILDPDEPDYTAILQGLRLKE